MPGFSPLIVRFPARVAPSADDFFDFCQANPSVRIERTSEGDVIVMTPAGGESSRRNAEMREYLANGARLGWLIDPFDRQAFVCRPGQSVERVAEPVGLLGDAVLPAFTLDLREIWSDSL